MSETELSEAFNMSLTTIKYNIDMLIKAELVKVKNVDSARAQRLEGWLWF